MARKFDIFVSHSSINADLAKSIVGQLERKGMNCFIAPRNMTGGSDYATELIDNIDECPIFLFLFTEESNKSGMVIREVNEAVNADRYIITLKVDNVVPNKSLRFYLSITHWLEISEPIDIEDINTILDAVKKALAEQKITEKEESAKEIRYKGYHVTDTNKLLDIGYTHKQINIACLNIDFEYLKKEDFADLIDAEISEQEWLDNFEMYPDLADFLVFDDEIVGYYTYAYVNDENYEKLCKDDVLCPQMFEYYEFGGAFNVCATFFPASKGHGNGQNFKNLVDAFFNKLIRQARENDVTLKKVMIISYTDNAAKAFNALGLKCEASNSVNGKIYVITKESLRGTRFCARYPEFEQILIDGTEDKNA